MEYDYFLDGKGFVCSMNLVKLIVMMSKIPVGKVLKMESTDPSSKTDIPSWCKIKGQELISTSEVKGVYTYYIRKIK